ncbi:RagB/SusD family nutrient uptake outer membrane protein [Galbibacter sp. EGI 63066]|uniref:RagB/SusD family nutrient uptake outer membrane protein n=1 Tax=Galbibacter sp. EGI 63066 TaxID=2993559 RepID=UPI00224932F2|nr:RagB/SusD family nutrient uptake outer membrane protein [Galbibacter sp. EGI 63066]MCX2681900.1 RagB/SusD family nutrient uptake outer membrane protein [Galbibacter sp. EGI 63066]
MKQIQKKIFLKKYRINDLICRCQILKLLTLFSLIIGLTSCSDFVEVEPPKNLLISETVFSDPATVESALANIFYKIREQGSMVSGRSGMTTLMGIYSDELDYYGFDTNSNELFHHNVTASNAVLLSWWNNAYNLIYATNDIIGGVENSNALNAENKARYKGQALFVRAYIHSLLTNLYGDIPYITSTNYSENNSVARLPVAEVYEHVISDLTSAVDLLENINVTGERVLPSQDTALALLSRIYLYVQNWEMAESTATQLIGKHSLEPNISKVFLKESSETLWQLKPGDSPKNTHEANQFIIQAIPGQQFALTDSLLDAFEPGDLRLNNWIGTASNIDGTVTLYFPYKYKAYITESQSLEYSIVFRLAEQYLIRAEARAHLENISGAQNDLNRIRNRAGLSNTMANSMNDLLEAIIQERRVELFAEHGQRWFDLKRTGNAGSILSLVKPNWQETDVLFPIPESELEINPNLLPQNLGY